MIKPLIFTLSLVFTAGTMAAQSQAEAVTNTLHERYEDASSDFKKLIRSAGGSAELYFYAGDNYLYWEELDSARAMF
ncbi:MAG: hypothetical protein ACK54P_16660, partial [Bacteroidota bacterium]